MKIDGPLLPQSSFNYHFKNTRQPAISPKRMDTVSLSAVSRSWGGRPTDIHNSPLDEKTRYLLEKAVQEELSSQSKVASQATGSFWDSHPFEGDYGACWFAMPNNSIRHVLPADADPNGVTWVKAPFDRAVETLAATMQKETGLPLIRERMPNISSEFSRVAAGKDEGGGQNAPFPSYSQTLPQSLIDWLMKNYQTTWQEEKTTEGLTREDL